MPHLCVPKCNRVDQIDLVLSSGKPLFEGNDPIVLQSGTEYTINITADGTAELAISGAEFFRAISMNEIDVENIETEDTGYEFDGVFCADDQYDIDLDANLQVTNKLKE